MFTLCFPLSLPPSHAHSLEGQTIPPECAIKVFKTTLNEFKNRDRYIKDDYRFKDRFGKQNPRKVVKLWAEKEMHNLKRYMVSYVCPKSLIWAQSASCFTVDST